MIKKFVVMTHDSGKILRKHVKEGIRKIGLIEI